MEKIKEEIREIDDTSGSVDFIETDKGFKEMSISLTTNEVGVQSFETRPIKGWLDCIIIKSKNIVDFGMHIEGDYEIMGELHIQGTNIYFPRAQGKAVGSREYMNFSTPKYSVNSPLIISVNSNPNVEVNIIVRWI